MRVLIAAPRSYMHGDFVEVPGDVHEIVVPIRPLTAFYLTEDAPTIPMETAIETLVLSIRPYDVDTGWGERRVMVALDLAADEKMAVLGAAMLAGSGKR